MLVKLTRCKSICAAQKRCAVCLDKLKCFLVYFGVPFDAISIVCVDNLVAAALEC